MTCYGDCDVFDKLAAAESEIEKLTVEREFHKEMSASFKESFIAANALLDRAAESFHAIILHGQHPSHDTLWAAFCLDMAEKALEAIQAARGKT